MAKEQTLEVKVTPTHLEIRIPLLKPMKESKTGKSLVVATTHGNMTTEAVVNGKPVFVGLNAYIKQ